MSVKKSTVMVALLLCGAASAQIQRVAPMAAPEIGQQAPQAQARAQAPSAAPAQSQRRPDAPMPVPGQELVREAIQMVAPLDTQQIKAVRKELNERSRAASEPIIPQAKPASRVVSIDLTPGATPELIRISLSEGAVVSFIDAAGRPWDVKKADSFNPQGLDIALFGDNSISVASKMEQAVGNVAVLLEGMSSPLSFRVISGHAASRELDYSVVMQLPRYLPGQPVPVGQISSQPSLGADELMDYLLRTPPRGSKTLKVEGLPGALAWQTPSGRIMLRTDRMVLSPNWKRRQAGTDGVAVYDLSVTPYVLVSDSGRMVNVKISGFSITQESRK